MSVIITTRPEACEAVRMLDLGASRQGVAQALVEFAATFNCDEQYAFDFHVGTPNNFELVPLGAEVEEHPANSHELFDWDGKLLSANADGPVFAIRDGDGLVAWCGIKRQSPHAQDIYVATRPDRRRQGLARTVASHAIRRLLDEGIVPYYAHLSTNTASAQLAKALGFVFYATGVEAAS